jgi:hypothetical protein
MVALRWRSDAISPSVHPGNRHQVEARSRPACRRGVHPVRRRRPGTANVPRRPGFAVSRPRMSLNSPPATPAWASIMRWWRGLVAPGLTPSLESQSGAVGTGGRARSRIRSGALESTQVPAASSLVQREDRAAMPQRCPNPGLVQRGSLSVHAAELGEPGGQRRDRTADLAVQPSETHPDPSGIIRLRRIRPAQQGMEADLSSGLIHIRTARCGTVGQNAGRIAALGQRMDHRTTPPLAVRSWPRRSRTANAGSRQE